MLLYCVSIVRYAFGAAGEEERPGVPVNAMAGRHLNTGANGDAGEGAAGRDTGEERDA